MDMYFITEQNFQKFLATMIEDKKVVGPIAKRKKFIFSEVKNPQELRLDYDVTILPPKKEFFPTRQQLVTFDGEDYKGCVKPEEKVIFGVHYYDIKAIDQLDFVFTDNKKDINYMANREAATIVGSNIQNISARAFWGSVGTKVQPKGHDAFLTKVKDGYTFECLTEKGKALLKYGEFTEATADHTTETKEVNETVKDKCPEKLNCDSSEEIAKKVREAFGNNKLWEECAEDCFSCGSCNTICPTCYCFDVQDKWNVDQKSGARTRTWDACLTEDFAKISLGGGATENFRETRGARFRHRMMRKATYLNEKLGGPACVGCGRCSSACTADIADPVNVINKIMEA